MRMKECQRPTRCISSIALLTCLLLGTQTLAGGAELAFRPGPDGRFSFDTGPFRGHLIASPTGQGLCSLIDTASGRELTKGSDTYGIFSFYRLLGTDQRWGEFVWAFPKTAEPTDDGGVRIAWPAKPEHPFDMSGTFRWVATDTLDVRIEVTAHEAARNFELFLGSYFADGFRTQVYVRGRDGQPRFQSPDINPLIAGTYLAFPRDHRTGAIIYDGRWLKPPHPVNWAITGNIARPLVLQQDRVSGLTCAIMARPRDCFVVSTPYNMEPPEDGVAGHHSTYLSLFGADLRAGQTLQAFLRLVVGKLTPDQAVARYDEFLKMYPEPTTRPESGR